MADYQTVVQKFVNRGVVQKLDADSLGEGMYYSLVNATSVQEGSIASRRGANRLVNQQIGSLITSMFFFHPDSDPSHRYLYVSEGSSIFRVKLSSGTVETMEGSLPDWHKRLSAVCYNTGTAGKPYIYFAGGKMLKDCAITSSGSETSSMERWGILPPPAAPVAQIGDELEQTIYSGAPIETVWTSSPDESNVFKEIVVRTTSVNLGQFSNGVPSGTSQNFYENDDYIELKIRVSNPDRMSQIYLQFDVSDTAGLYADYYERIIVPFVKKSGTQPLYTGAVRTQVTEYGIVQTDVYETDPRGEGEIIDPSRPIEMPPIASIENDPQEATIQIRKREFLKVGKAGTSGKDWSSIKHVRLLAQYGSLAGGPDQKLIVVSMRLVGGGGLDNSDPSDVPYQWVYTYRNDKTGHESNPSPLMVESAHIRSVKRRPVVLTGIVRSTDPQVTSIAIYRSGGAWTDGEFRLVGYIDNPSSGTGTFVDVLDDADLVYARICDWDNDPPVPSRLPEQVSATMPANSGTGLQSVTLTVLQPSGASLQNILTVGTRLQVSSLSGSEEIQVVTISGNTITAYFQLIHSGTVRLTCGTVVGMPCRFAAMVGNSIYLAGDPNNPCRIYKSKSGRPESFPAVTEVTGRVNHMDVSSPPNRILGITEFGGECIVLTRNNLYIIRVFNGQMLDPVETPAQRGVLCEFAWCKGNNALYYLSDDGIYAWAGSQAVKITTQIDWFFRNETVNGISPLDRSESALRYISLHCHNNRLYFSGLGQDGYCKLWVYDISEQRWSLYDAAREGANSSGWSAFCSSNTSDLYSARWFHDNSGVRAYLYLEESGILDNGAQFPVVVHTGFYTLGTPTLQKQWGDIVLEGVIPADMTVKVYADFNLASPIDQFTINGGSGRRRIPLPFNDGRAREAYALSFRFETQATSAGRLTLHSMTFNVLPLAHVQRGRATDWSEYGYPHDKRLDQLIIKYDTAGQPVTLYMDITSGLAGSVRTDAAAAFTLNSNGPTTSSFPIRDANGNPIIAKTIRLRPAVTSHLFQIYDATVTYEKYPPDITLFTDPNDYGSPYEKHFQQLLLDIDTGGVPASVSVYLDNDTAPFQTFTVVTTTTDRQRNLVLRTGATGKKAYLRLMPGSGGKTQLFGHTFIVLPADKGAVLHSYDWDDLGYPFDKKIISFAMEYEVSEETEMVLEGISGTTPSEQQPFEIMRFMLSPSGRKKITYNIPEDTIVKMIRFHPVSGEPDPDAKIYKYQFSKIDYPPDVILQTDWSDLGWHCDKVIRAVTLNVDTGGLEVVAWVEVDGQRINQPLSLITSQFDRSRTFSLVSDLNNTEVIGRLVRLVFDVPDGGKCQLFDVKWSAFREPCELTFFDTFEQYFGSNGYKYIKQIWVEYRSKGAINLEVYGDGARLIYQTQLPPSDYRTCHRFYLPSVGVQMMNKSKSFRIIMESEEEDKPFYLYRDSSRVEVMNLSADSRAGYYQTYLWSEMPIPV